MRKPVAQSSPFAWNYLGWVPGDPLSTEALCYPGPGRMLGVLVCQRSATVPGGEAEEVVLRAFSGQVRQGLTTPAMIPESFE